jgi:hypothetical protein
MVVPWFLQNFTGVDGWVLGGWFLLVLMTILAVCLGCLFVWGGRVFCLLSAI